MRNFELEIFFSKWEFKAKYHLTASDMESMSTKELLAMASSEDRDKYESLGCPSCHHCQISRVIVKKIYGSPFLK